MKNKNIESQEDDNLVDKLGDWTKLMKKKGTDFAKDVWDSTKREGKETKEAVKILHKMVKGESVSDDEKIFLKAQSTDLIKILPLVAIQGIPVPIPITPLLIMLSKKYNIPIFPNSHTKMSLEQLEENKKEKL